MRGKKSRLAAVVAAAGACAMLAACSPVKIGSAAIVGNDRITASSLGTQVSNLQADLKPYKAKISTQAMSASVLSWLIKFQVQDRVAANAGITVTQDDADHALTVMYLAENTFFQQQNESLPPSLKTLVQLLPNNMSNELGTYYAQFLAFEKQANGGTLPAAARQLTPDAAYEKAACQAEKSLNIQVNPQYGQLNYSAQAIGGIPVLVDGAGSFFYFLSPSNDMLSRPTGKASPAVTPSFPAC